MIDIITGHLIVEPQAWTLVFSRSAATRWTSFIALGRYKHVSAYAYVPFLHVWVHYDVRLSGTHITIAANDAAHAMIGTIIADADLISMQKRPQPSRQLPPLLGWCVPAVRRLLGVPGSALRPDAFFKECLANGGVPFEAAHGRTEIRTTTA